MPVPPHRPCAERDSDVLPVWSLSYLRGLKDAGTMPHECIWLNSMIDGSDVSQRLPDNLIKKIKRYQKQSFFLVIRLIVQSVRITRPDFAAGHVSSDRNFRIYRMCEGRKARPTPMDLRSIPVEVHAFESHPSHFSYWVNGTMKHWRDHVNHFCNRG